MLAHKQAERAEGRRPLKALANKALQLTKPAQAMAFRS
jgi:hypothetical protein